MFYRNGGVHLIQAVFIDRDGTIGGGDQVILPGEFKLFPNIQESIDQLKTSGIFICSFTNQPGISKGEVKKEEFERELKSFGFDRIYLCPHQHDEGCSCRKPRPGMLLRAAEENCLDLKQCVVIGDRWTDLMAGAEVGCTTILVRTGSGEEAYKKYKNQEYFGNWSKVQPDYIALDFNDAVSWILQKNKN